MGGKDTHKDMGTELIPSALTTGTISVYQRLAKLEQIIDANLSAFYAVGCALREIKNARLYKLGHSRFDDYCAKRWDMHYSHAKRLEDAAIVIDNLKGSPNWRGFYPQKESQVRPLTPLEQELQCIVWNQVIEAAPMVQDKPKITTKLVTETVAKLTGKEPKRPKGKRKGLQLTIDDSLSPQLDKVRKIIENVSKNKVQKDWIVETILKKAFDEMERKGQESETLASILAAIEEQSKS